ncbi:unnamed protein product [Anisakis simplex]|uniref:Uncharacterized protein n=1 Tax=Anisakis simplex TaxID=6269 RepID=A0A3P6Q401_ANISI|nr:unnamed protein product [Anisakis simplex]
MDSEARLVVRPVSEVKVVRPVSEVKVVRPVSEVKVARPVSEVKVARPVSEVKVVPVSEAQLVSVEILDSEREQGQELLGSEQQVVDSAEQPGSVVRPDSAERLDSGPERPALEPERLALGLEQLVSELERAVLAVSVPVVPDSMLRT